MYEGGRAGVSQDKAGPGSDHSGDSAEALLLHARIQCQCSFIPFDDMTAVLNQNLWILEVEQPNAVQFVGHLCDGVLCDLQALIHRYTAVAVVEDIPPARHLIRINSSTTEP